MQLPKLPQFPQLSKIKLPKYWWLAIVLAVIAAALVMQPSKVLNWSWGNWTTFTWPTQDWTLGDWILKQQETKTEKTLGLNDYLCAYIKQYNVTNITLGSTICYKDAKQFGFECVCITPI